MSTKEHDFGVTEESYSLLKVSATELLDDIDEQSPYCEVCGTCGYLGCCGIKNFIDEHIKGKTNCKNEDLIISELINLCEYKDEVFKQNQKYKEVIDKIAKSEEEIMYLANKTTITTQNLEVRALRDRLEDIFEILKGDSSE